MMPEQRTYENEADDDDIFLILAQRLFVSETFSAECMNSGEQLVMTEDMISNMLEKREYESTDDENVFYQKNMMHSVNMSSIEKQILYTEQQEEATHSILMTLTQWRNIASKKSLSTNKKLSRSS